MLIGLGLAAWAAYRVVFTLARVFRADRIRRERLRALEREPATVGRGSPAGAARDLDAAVEHAVPENLTLTGVFLASMGVAAVFAGRTLAYGNWAVGLYTAGLGAIVGGVAVALIGAVLRVLARPLHRDDENFSTRF